MTSLADAQANFIDTINDGPARLDPMLFAGAPDRVLLGLKAHANAISHSRLAALEDTFPLTRQYLGDAAFNASARDFAESKLARASDACRIGQYFADFLSDRAAIELSKIEWAWLESYHAAEALSLTLADLGRLDEAPLLALPVARHPSARIVPISVRIAAALDGLAGEKPAAMLSIRPDAEVRLVPLDDIQRSILEAAAGIDATLGNLLGVAIELAGEQAPLKPLLHVINAGALIMAER